MKGVARTACKLARGVRNLHSRSALSRPLQRAGLLAAGFSFAYFTRGWVAKTEEENEEGRYDFLNEVEEYSEEEALPTLSGAKHVIGKELNKLITKPAKDVFILKYTDHCPSCLVFHTLSEQLADAFKGVDTMVIGLYRSDLNFCRTPAYTNEEQAADPVPKLFPATGKREQEGITMDLKTSQSEAILKWLYDNCTHKFDYDAVLRRLRETHATTDALLIKRYTQFNLSSGAPDTQKKTAWENPKTANSLSFYMSLCDPWNPCASKELNWFAHLMTAKARSTPPHEKDAENFRLMMASVDCKLSPQFEAYLKAVSEFALNQMDQVDEQRAKREGKPSPHHARNELK